MPALLKQVGKFDRRIALTQQRRGLRIVGVCKIGSAGCEIETTELAEDSRRPSLIIALFEEGQRTPVVIACRLPLARRAAEIGKSLIEGNQLRSGLRMIRNRRKRFAVEAHRIVIGVGLAGKIARSHEVPDTLPRLVGSAIV